MFEIFLFAFEIEPNGMRFVRGKKGAAIGEKNIIIISKAAERMNLCKKTRKQDQHLPPKSHPWNVMENVFSIVCPIGKHLNPINLYAIYRYGFSLIILNALTIAQTMFRFVKKKPMGTNS